MGSGWAVVEYNCSRHNPKGLNFLKIRILFLALLFVTQSVALAQDAEPSATQRELITLLEYGDGVFQSGDWRVYQAGESENASYAVWTLQAESVGAARIIHFDETVTTEYLTHYFNNSLFEYDFTNYTEWKLTTHCESDGMLLYEFDLTRKNEHFAARYWARPEGEDTVWTITLIFPKAQPDLLDEYASAFYSDFISCAALGIAP
jgi:hypothetical protein